MYIPELKGPQKKAWRRLAGRVYQAGPRISPWATILAAVVAVLSLSYGYEQFRETLELDRDSKAVELLVKYNDMMREARSGQLKDKTEDEFWRDNSALLIAETIFKLKGDDEGWRETVRWILRNHTDFLEAGLDCETYDKEFIEFLKIVMERDAGKKVQCLPKEK